MRLEHEVSSVHSLLAVLDDYTISSDCPYCVAMASRLQGVQVLHTQLEPEVPVRPDNPRHVEVAQNLAHAMPQVPGTTPQSLSGPFACCLLNCPHLHSPAQGRPLTFQQAGLARNSNILLTNTI